MKVDKPKKARILIYDIETSPNLAYTWGKWQQDVIAFEREWYILMFAYKWLGEKRTHVVKLPDFELYKKDPSNDRELVKKLRDLFDEADVVIAHNGDSFDQKKSQARMLVHGIDPPSPYQQIDTKKVARKYFNFNSNKLDDLGAILHIGRKVETGGFKLWLGCMNGVQAAWNTMARYNKQDVVLLEEIYLAMRGWMTNHPAMNMLEDRPHACPKCGADGQMMAKRGNYVTKKVNRMQVWFCKNCNGHSSLRTAEPVKEKVMFVS